MFHKDLEEYFESRNFEIYLFPLNVQRKFVSLQDLYDFALELQEYWKHFDQKKFFEISNCINQIVTDITHANQQALNNQIDNARQTLNSALNSLSRNAFPMVFMSPEAELLKNLYTIDLEQANAACEFLFSQHSNLPIQINNKSHLSGMIQAFILKNPNLQDNVLKNIDDFLKVITEHSINYVNTADKEHYERIKKIEKENDEFKTSTETWKNELATSTEVWKQNLETDTRNFVDAKKAELDDLVNLYREQLKLEEPAKYWEQAAKDYAKQGRNWIIVTGILLATFIAFLIILLFKLPNSKTSLNFTTIKMSIILTVIISAGLLLINLFIKLSLSAYHLSRDAQERHKLAYVYLALLKEKAVEESDRTVVLQSLFSRSDTGLLKGDSSPTIPDGMIAQALKTLTQKH